MQRPNLIQYVRILSVLLWFKVLWQGYKFFCSITVPYLEQVCATTLAEDLSGPSLESRVWHSFLYAGVYIDVNHLSLCEFLDSLAYRGNPSLSYRLLQLVTCTALFTM